MKYPTISAADVERLFDELAGDNPELADPGRAVKWVGSGEEVDLEALEKAVEGLRSEVEPVDPDKRGEKDRLEGIGSMRLYEALDDLPLEVVDDPGFWRYIGMVHLWWFVEWREPTQIRARDYAKAKCYFDGRNHSECVPLRMYLRGRIAKDAGELELAGAAASATDLWRSHIVRIRTSYNPALAGALVRQQADGGRRLSTDDVRLQAKRLTRYASNVVLFGYTENDAMALVEELRAGVVQDAQEGDPG